MPRLIKRSAKKTGLPPGSVVHVGEIKVDVPRITVITYGGDGIEEKSLTEHEADTLPEKPQPKTWINIDGLHKVNLIETIGKKYQLHPLILEDIVNTNQRPKAEAEDNCFFVVIRMLSYDDQTHRVRSEHMSFVLGDHFLLSFQEGAGDVLEAVRKRLRNGKGRLRTQQADYLLYALLDCIVDHYFVVLEKLGLQIEDLQDTASLNEKDDIPALINNLKQEMIVLRKVVGPVLELSNTLLKTESDYIHDAITPYLKDLHDHVKHVADLMDNYREMLDGNLIVYLTSISNRMNAVMKVLTIIATIFIPLTFIASIYGMNFEHMPELAWRWGYAAVWTIMLIVGIIMLSVFKKKGWL